MKIIWNFLAGIWSKGNGWDQTGAIKHVSCSSTRHTRTHTQNKRSCNRSFYSVHMPTSRNLKLSSVRPTPNYKTIQGCTTPSERQQMLQPKISTRRPAACPAQVSLHTSSEVCYIQLHYTFPKQVWVWVSEWVSVSRSKCTADLLLTLDGTHLLMVPRSPTTDRMDGQTTGAEITGIKKTGKKRKRMKRQEQMKDLQACYNREKNNKKGKRKKNDREWVLEKTDWPAQMK